MVLIESVLFRLFSQADGPRVVSLESKLNCELFKGEFESSHKSVNMQLESQSLTRVTIYRLMRLRHIPA